MCNRCGRLFFLSAWARVACTRSGCQDRSTRTVCRSAMRSRTWDRFHSAAFPAKRYRIACTGTRRAFRANSQVLAPCCSRVLQAVLAPAFRRIPCAALPHGRGLDNHADDISLPHEPPPGNSAFCRSGAVWTTKPINHEAHEETRSKLLMIDPLCNFVSFCGPRILRS